MSEPAGTYTRVEARLRRVMGSVLSGPEYADDFDDGAVLAAFFLAQAINDDVAFDDTFPRARMLADRPALRRLGQLLDRGQDALDSGLGPLAGAGLIVPSANALQIIARQGRKADVGLQ